MVEKVEKVDRNAPIHDSVRFLIRIPDGFEDTVFLSGI